MVALGESGAQSVSFGQDSGVIETRPTDGYLMIKHSDYDGWGTDTELYNETLGAVVYENGDSELAYQGGGVWRKDAQGKAQVISPPEFHYRGETLTLPVVRVNGNASGSGSVSTRISASTRAEKVYPDQSVQYSNNSQYYLNPIRTGNVSVYVKSDYYRGWATYFRERTEGNVTVFDGNQTVKVQLKSIGGAPGEFDMPRETKSLDVEGFGENHPINEFTITLKGNNKDFNNGQWSLYSTQGGDEFEMHIEFQDKCNGGYSGTVDFSVYYYNSSTDVSHEWQNDSIDPNADSAFDVDCANNEFTVDLASTKTNLTYGEIEPSSGANNQWCFGANIDDYDVEDSPTLNIHGSADGPTTFEKNVGNHTMNYVVNHYMERMGVNYDLTVTDGPGNSECLTDHNNNNNNNNTGPGRINEDQSSGVLRYDEDGGAQYITYLHVTDNEVNVTAGP
jgi:hypothetical protein